MLKLPEHKLYKKLMNKLQGGQRRKRSILDRDEKLTSSPKPVFFSPEGKTVGA